RDLANEILSLGVSQKASSIEDVLALKAANGLTIQENITDLTGKIGEKLVITHFETVSGEFVTPYIHSNGKLGVVVALKNVGGANVSDAGKDVAMQIAAMKPIAVDKDQVDAKTIEREIEIGKEQARAEGKPEAMLEKIALGKLNKFYKDSTLLNQDFVKDNSKTIAQYLDGVQKGLTVTKFIRISIGA
ncbi:MAG: translation elongation factor Ts, partial [Cytophagales bacterium]|nr:translation elongation factor Ts [Cytophagales bacterium]